MRLISFMMTMDAVRNEFKDVTRRLGWNHLREGDILCGVEKGQGLPPGQSVTRINIVRVAWVEAEPLQKLIDDPKYARIEITREGFPQEANRPAEEWVKWFCDGHSTPKKPCTPETVVNRIEFDYVLPALKTWNSYQMRAVYDYEQATGDQIHRLQVGDVIERFRPDGTWNNQGREYLHQMACWRIRVVNWLKDEAPHLLEKI